MLQGASVVQFVPGPRDWWPDTKEDWRAVSCAARCALGAGALTDEQFEAFWAGFQAMKVRLRGERRLRGRG